MNHKKIIKFLKIDFIHVFLIIFIILVGCSSVQNNDQLFKINELDSEHIIFDVSTENENKRGYNQLNKIEDLDNYQNVMKTLAEKDINQTCISNILEKTVRGVSLSGYIEEGSIINLIEGYFVCNPVERGHIVAYNYGGNSVPVIKIVKGIPEDTMAFEQRDKGWIIKINGLTLETELGPYFIKNPEMLLLYVEGFSGKIPKDAYLLFGTLQYGSLDSTRFGLVHKDDFLGRIFFG